MLQQMQKQLQGQKRGPENLDAKSKLYHVMALVLGRTIRREDITFQLEAIDGQHKATVTIVERDQSFEGDLKASKKEAEISACEACFDGMADEIATAQEAHS